MIQFIISNYQVMILINIGLIIHLHLFNILLVAHPLRNLHSEYSGKIRFCFYVNCAQFKIQRCKSMLCKSSLLFFTFVQRKHEHHFKENWINNRQKLQVTSERGCLLDQTLLGTTFFMVFNQRSKTKPVIKGLIFEICLWGVPFHELDFVCG